MSTRQQGIWILLLLIITTLLCKSAFCLDNTQEAKKYFSRGIAAAENAKSTEGYNNAVRELEMAKKFAPKWPDVYYNLGLLYEQIGQSEDALGNLQKYLEMSPLAADAENVRQAIVRIQHEKKKIQDPGSLTGVWVQKDDIHENSFNRLEIRNNKGRIEARVLPIGGWRLSESLNPVVFIPDGEFVPVEWDGENLKILYATAYGCAQSASVDNCPRQESYLLKKIADNELSGECKVKGYYYISASGRQWVNDFSFKKIWIRKSK